MGMHEWIKYVFGIAEKWTQAISEPQQFLAPSFQPTEDQLYDGLEFYLIMLAVSLLLSAPVALSQKGEWADKMRIITNAVFGLLTSIAIAMTWHFSFWMRGGQGNFAGTYLAYVFAMSPYLPLMTLASLLTVAGLPPHLRRSAMNPNTAQEAVLRSQNDPKTSTGTVALGCLAAGGLLVWSNIVLFRCLSLVHSISGWQFATAIALSFFIAIPVGLVLRKLNTLVAGEPETGAGASEG